MSACGDADDCISTPEAAELAAELDEKTIKNLPRPGQVDFISGGPPCQVYRSIPQSSSRSYFVSISNKSIMCLLILAIGSLLFPGIFWHE